MLNLEPVGRDSTSRHSMLMLGIQPNVGAGLVPAQTTFAPAERYTYRTNMPKSPRASGAQCV